MRLLLQYVQKWWKIRREVLHSYKINFLFADRNKIRRNVQICRGRNRTEKKNGTMQRMYVDESYWVHLHTMTEPRPVQTMLWRLVASICSCKHSNSSLCVSVPRLRSFSRGWFGWRSRPCTLYSNQDWSRVEGSLCLAELWASSFVVRRRGARWMPWLA